MARLSRETGLISTCLVSPANGPPPAAREPAPANKITRKGGGTARLNLKTLQCGKFSPGLSTPPDPSRAALLLLFFLPKFAVEEHIDLLRQAYFLLSLPKPRQFSADRWRPGMQNCVTFPLRSSLARELSPNAVSKWSPALGTAFTPALSCFSGYM
jgi:hypothetical protein